MSDLLALFLSIVSGISWTIVYISAIRIGFKDKTYAIPVLALALNFAWELIYGLGGVIIDPKSLQSWINLTWGFADAVIVYNYFVFGKSEFPPSLTRRIFFAGSVLIFVVAFAVQAAFIVQFKDEAPIYAAFLQNTLMSGLFLGMFVAREGMRGQSLTIAVSKCIGTLAATIVFSVITFTPLVLIVGIVCFVLDTIYIGLIANVKRHGATFDPVSVEDGPEL
jgi:hypothetical protein